MSFISANAPRFEVAAQSGTPTTAANCASNNTFPAINAQLYNSQYNFSSGVRDDTSFNRNWDSANLIIQQSDQVAYSNTSLTNLGTYNATYSFTDDRAGGLAEGLAYTMGAGCTAQVTSYLGHQNVLQLADAGAGSAIAIWTFPSSLAIGAFECWVCPSDVTKIGSILFKVSGATSSFLYYWDSGGLRYGDSTVVDASFATNRWMHFRVSWTASAETLYVNGILRDTRALTITTLQYVQFATNDAATGYSDYYDACDWSGTTGYWLGRSAIDLGQLGVYNATNSFESETMFAVPASTYQGTWADGSGATCYARVFPQVATGAYGHRNVLCLDDQNAGTTAQVQFSYTGNQIAGTIEYWFLSTNVAFTTHCQFYGWNAAHAANPWNIYISASVLYASGTGTVNIGAVVSNTWYHVRIAFDTVADTFSVWVNGMLKTSTQAAVAVTEVAQIVCNTGAVGNVLQVYLDGIDFSCDPLYYTERSTYLRLNSTQQFSVQGAYSSMWQVWSVAVNYNAPPTPFTVQENLQLISESGAQTNWIFIDPATGSWDLLYNASWPYETWGFSNYGWIEIPYATIAGDTYTLSTVPDANRGTNTFWEERTGERFGFLKMPSCSYLTDNGTTGLKIYCSSASSYDSIPVSVDGVGSFNEDTITYNNQPSITAHLTDYNRAGGALLWDYVNFNSNYSYVKLTIATGIFYVFQYRSKEYGSVTPMANYTVGKTAQDSYHVMMQANATETLTMRSPTLSSLNLQANDKIQITFSTTSQRQITLNLKNGGNVVKATVLSDAPNYVYTTQTKEIAITSDVTLDQIEFTGLFDDTKNLRITNITILRPTLYSSFDVSPYSKEYVSLIPANYSLTVFEAGALVLSQSVTIASYALNKISYSPLSGGQRIVNLFNPSGDILDFYQFRCNLTRTYNNLTVNYLLSTPYFYADDASTFQLNVTDRFGNDIVSWSDVVSTFIDITLTNVFSLKIKNEMRLPTLLQLTRNLVTQSEYAMAGEIVAYTLWNGTYELNYTQTEISQSICINLNVTSATIYNISTAYRTVFFSCFSNDGLGVSVDTIRLYLNGSRKSWGPVEILGIANITAMDYIGDVQYTGIVDLSDVSEFNVFVNIATVITNNLDNERPLAICIWKNSILLQNQTVGAQASLAFRFTNGHYDVGAFYTNGTSYGANQSVDVLASGTDLKTYTLTWGTYHPDLPQQIPTPGFPELIMLIAVIAVIGLIVTWILVAHERSKRKESERLMYEMSRRGR